MAMPSWAVVATVDEPAPLVVAFAAHHLALGAAGVEIFLDHPDPEAEDALRALPGCRVTLCDEAHWAASSRGKRPLLHPGRQITNARIAHDRCRADWLLHADADEFLRDAGELEGELGGLPAHHAYLRLPVAERAWTLDPAETDLFAGVFRMALADWRRVGPAVYGALSDYFKQGLTGHKAGKALVRTGQGLLMDIHAPGGTLPHRTADGLQLLHFDGVTPLHYALKLLRRAQEPPIKAPLRHGAAREAQIAALREVLGVPGDIAQLVRHLKMLDPGQIAALRAAGGVDERPFQPLGDNILAADLTLPAFDAALRRRHADLLVACAPGL